MMLKDITFKSVSILPNEVRGLELAQTLELFLSALRRDKASNATTNVLLIGSDIVETTLRT